MAKRSHPRIAKAGSVLVLVAAALLAWGIIASLRSQTLPLSQLTTDSSAPTPIPIADLPVVGGALIQEHNLISQIAGQLVAAAFSSDPTAPAPVFSEPPKLAAFLYNSTPCAQLNKETNYRLVVRGESAHPATDVTIHLVTPEEIQVSSLSPSPSNTEPDQRSYFWVLPHSIANDSLVSITASGVVTAAADSEAHLIVTYAGLADSDTRQVISTHRLAACQPV